MKIRIKEYLKKVGSYFKEVRLEMKQINWLSFKETVKYTFVVLLVSIIVSIFLGGIDFLLTLLLKKFIFR
jgi:preprotein translocase subunit SecE